MHCCTYGDVDLQPSVDRGPEPGIQYDASELYSATRFVDRTVGLNEDRVTLVYIIELCRFLEQVTRDSACKQPVSPRSGIADLRMHK